MVCTAQRIGGSVNSSRYNDTLKTNYSPAHPFHLIMRSLHLTIDLPRPTTLTCSQHLDMNPSISHSPTRSRKPIDQERLAMARSTYGMKMTSAKEKSWRVHARRVRKSPDTETLEPSSFEGTIAWRVPPVKCVGKGVGPSSTRAQDYRRPVFARARLTTISGRQRSFCLTPGSTLPHRTPAPCAHERAEDAAKRRMEGRGAPASRSRRRPRESRGKARSE